MKIAVVGASGYGNVGDDAYREILAHYLRGHSCRFYNSDLPQEFPADADLMILGGGGLIYHSRKPQTAAHFDYMRWYMEGAIERNIPWGFLSCGVQLNVRGDGYDRESLLPWREYLRRANFLSVRSETDVEILRELTGREEIDYFPDLCYLAAEVWGRPEPNGEKYLLLIPTAFHDVRKREVRELIAEAEDAGWDILITNFGAETDDGPTLDRCSAALAQARVVRNPCPQAAFHLVAGASLVITGRYHGMIFARAAGVPCFVPSSGTYKIREESPAVHIPDAIRHLEALEHLQFEPPKRRLLLHGAPRMPDLTALPYYRPESPFQGEIATVMITCPDREIVLHETLASLEESDWPFPVRVFLDESTHPSRTRRQAENAFRALQAGFDSGAEYILFLEDDLKFNRFLYRNLLRWEPFRDGVMTLASLYNPGHRFPFRSPDANHSAGYQVSFYGSQALLIERETLRHILEHWAEVPGMQDLKIAHLAQQLGRPLFLYCPSLVEHVGVQSTWGGRYHASPDFDKDWQAPEQDSPPQAVELANDVRGFERDQRPEGHYFDRALAERLSQVFQGLSVADLGCGRGRYVAHFREKKIPSLGLDGNPHTALQDDCRVRDLTRAFELGCRFHWVLSLEVGEHIPPKYQEEFLNNLTRYARLGIVLSWAVPGQGGRGHLNEQPNSALRRLMRERDWISDLHLENQLREVATLPWFRETLLVFRPSR